MSSQNPFAVPEVFGDSTFVAASPRNYGGIRRLPYFGYTFANGFVSKILSVAAGAAGIAEAAILIALISLVLTILISVKRLKNLGHSGWWVLGLIVPILNIVVSLRMLAAPEGYADHKTLDGPGKVIIGVLIGMFVMVIGMILLLVLRT
jgi:uncharacterized membrane protein YhaH (DUF805 family)